MRNALIIFSILTFAHVQAQPGGDFYENRQMEDMKRLVQFHLIDTAFQSDYSQSESQFVFQFENLMSSDSNAFISYSIDSVNYDGQLSAGQISIMTTPGNHSFQFYLNQNYLEVFSGILSIPAQYQHTYSVILFTRRAEVPIVTYKPVIYLYPETETTVEVELEIHNGKNPFYYPEYNENWTCVALPDGNIEMNGIDYRYLFWEAEQADHLEEIEVNEGFSVAGEDAVSFLEDKLTQVGFTSEERADFITFWGPKLAANENSLVRFEWNQTCDKFAELNITPQPDHVYRFYIFMSAIDSEVATQPQALPKFNREGFVALEWGGQISNYQPNTSL